MDQRTRTVAGIRMRWLEGGEGVPVILIHGIPTSPGLWRHVAPLLSGARVLAWELVGYGESAAEGRDLDLSLAAQADYLERFMGDTGVEAAVLVGHDLGGGIAQILAVRSPQRALGLVLTNSVGYDAWPVPTVKALRALSPLVRRMPPALLGLGLRLFMARAHEDHETAAESARLHVSRYARPGGPAALVRQIRALEVRDTVRIQDRLGALDLPSAVAWGDADPYLPPALGERLARDLGAPFQRIPGGRHFTPEDRPVEVAGAIQGVIDRLRT